MKCVKKHMGDTTPNETVLIVGQLVVYPNTFDVKE